VWFTEGNADAIGRLTLPASPEDTTAPTIRIDAPVQGSIAITGSPLAADFTCEDEGGSGLATCDGTVPPGARVDTAPGAHRFDVTASDGAGNTASASASYLAFTRVEGSIADGSARAGQWATLELGLGGRAPKHASDFVAPGSPVARQVDCADPSTALEPDAPADVQVSTRRDMLVTKWRAPRDWAGTCRAITFRFTAPGWQGADATFVVAFEGRSGNPHPPCLGPWYDLWQRLWAWLSRLIRNG
jgi:hypothetical protein